MDVPRLVRHSVKGTLACIAAISASFIILQALNPKAANEITAKVTGAEAHDAVSDGKSLFSRLFESKRERYSWEQDGPRTSSMGGNNRSFLGASRGSSTPGQSQRSAISVLRERYSSLLESSPGFAGEGGAGLLPINAIAMGNYRLAQPVAKVSGNLADKRTGRNRQPAPKAAQFPAAATAVNGKSPAVRTEENAGTSLQLSAERETTDNASAGAEDAASVDAAALRSKQEREMRKDDHVLAAAIIARAADDIRLTPHAVSVVKDFTHRYPGSPQSRELQGKIDALTRSQAQELHDRGTVDNSSKLAALLLSGEELNTIRTCLASTGFVDTVDVASIVLKRRTSLPAYAVAVNIKASSIVGMFGAGLTPEKSSSDKRMIAVSGCLRSLFSRGTVAFLFSGTSSHAEGIRRIRATDRSKIFWKGFAESAGSEMQRG